MQEQNSNLMYKYSNSLTPPYIAIENRTFLIVFNKIDGSVEGWSVPFSVLENEIKRGYYTRELMPEEIKIYNNFIPLCTYLNCGDLSKYKEIVQTGSIQYLPLKNTNGATFSVVDFRPFVDPSAFSKVIPDLYSQSKDGDDFIKEVWNVVTQLDVYAYDYPNDNGTLNAQAKYPLETFLAGGGICRDTAVLFASMIKAAPTNWDVGFLYMDTDHPEVPVTPNHLMVEIKTNNETYFIDTTQHQEMQPYENISGWNYKI